MPDIQQKVVVDPGQAVPPLQEIARATEAMAEATKKAGEAAVATSEAERKLSSETEKATDATREATAESANATDATEKQKSVTEDLGEAVGGMAAQWLSFTAMAGLIIQTITNINERAKEATESLAQMGQQVSNLSANVGGDMANKAFPGLAMLANESGFDVAGLNQLVGFASSISDVREFKSPEEIVEVARRGALLQRSTGGAIAGQQGAELFQLASARLGVSDDEVTDILATMGNSGFDAGTISDLISKGGDMNFLGLAMASRGSGLPRGVAGRQLSSVLSSLTRVDEQGEVPADLAGLGITGEMPAFERLQFLARAQASGQITAGQFFGATGGQQTQPLIRAILPALLKEGGVQSGIAELMNADGAESAVRNRLANPMVAAAELSNVRKLGIELRRAQEGLSPYAQGVAEFDADMEAGGGIPVPGLEGVASVIGGTIEGAQAPDDAVAAYRARWTKRAQDLYDPSPTRQRPGGIGGMVADMVERGNREAAVINNYNGCTIVNGKDPTTAPEERSKQE